MEGEYSDGWNPGDHNGKLSILEDLRQRITERIFQDIDIVFGNNQNWQMNFDNFETHTFCRIPATSELHSAASRLERTGLVEMEKCDDGNFEIHLVSYELSPGYKNLLSSSQRNKVRTRTKAKLHSILEDDSLLLREAGKHFERMLGMGWQNSSCFDFDHTGKLTKISTPDCSIQIELDDPHEFLKRQIFEKAHSEQLHMLSRQEEKLGQLPWRLEHIERFPLLSLIRSEVRDEHQAVLQELERLAVLNEDCAVRQFGTELGAVFGQIHAGLVSERLGALARLDWRVRIEDHYPEELTVTATSDQSDVLATDQGEISLTIDHAGLEIQLHQGWRENTCGQFFFFAEELLERIHTQRSEALTPEDRVLPKLSWRNENGFFVEVRESDLCKEAFEREASALARYFSLHGVDHSELDSALYSSRNRANGTRRMAFPRPPEKSALRKLCPEFCATLEELLPPHIEPKVNIEQILALPWAQESDGTYLLRLSSITEAEEKLLHQLPANEIRRIRYIEQGSHFTRGFLVQISNDPESLYQRLSSWHPAKRPENQPTWLPGLQFES